MKVDKTLGPNEIDILLAHFERTVREDVYVNMVLSFLNG